MKKSKILISSHIHSTGSDGKLTPEEMVKEAISEGLSYICFCDHYKWPEEFLRMRGEPLLKLDFQEYLDNIKELQKKYKNKIEIALGTEVDWLEEFKLWTAHEIGRFGEVYDLVLGSIHFLKINGQYFPVDESQELWEEAAGKIGAKKFVKEYYKQLRLMIKSKLFDCIGHFDVIKIYNKNSELFNENDKWYREEVLKTLNEVARTRMCIEINTHGFKKPIEEQYPSEWIIIEANKRKIPVTISSDAHRTGEVGDRLTNAVELARKAGYTSIMKFVKRKMVEVLIK